MGKTQEDKWPGIFSGNNNFTGWLTHTNWGVLISSARAAFVTHAEWNLCLQHEICASRSCKLSLVRIRFPPISKYPVRIISIFSNVLSTNEIPCEASITNSLIVGRELLHINHLKLTFLASRHELSRWHGWKSVITSELQKYFHHKVKALDLDLCWHFYAVVLWWKGEVL